MADVVEQDSLIELKGKLVQCLLVIAIDAPSVHHLGRRPHRLPDVFVRPALDGKRLAGEIEIHSNGVRYQSPLGQKIGKYR